MTPGSSIISNERAKVLPYCASANMLAYLTFSLQEAIGRVLVGRLPRERPGIRVYSQACH